MAEVNCLLVLLFDMRAKLKRELPARFISAHRKFLIGFAKARPGCSPLQCTHVDQLTALRWKLANLETFRKRRPSDFAAQARALDAGLVVAQSR